MRPRKPGEAAELAKLMDAFLDEGNTIREFLEQERARLQGELDAVNRKLAFLKAVEGAAPPGASVAPKPALGAYRDAVLEALRHHRQGATVPELLAHAEQIAPGIKLSVLRMTLQRLRTKGEVVTEGARGSTRYALVSRRKVSSGKTQPRRSKRKGARA